MSRASRGHDSPRVHLINEPTLAINYAWSGVAEGRFYKDFAAERNTKSRTFGAVTTL